MSIVCPVSSVKADQQPPFSPGLSSHLENSFGQPRTSSASSVFPCSSWCGNIMIYHVIISENVNISALFSTEFQTWLLYS